MPFTPTTTTFGLGFAPVCPKLATGIRLKINERKSGKALQARMGRGPPELLDSMGELYIGILKRTGRPLRPPGIPSKFNPARDEERRDDSKTLQHVELLTGR
jgi:hypothetical protein